MSQNLQWIRNITLVVSEGTPETGGPGIDLSQLRVKFRVEQAQTEVPDNAAIRVYNVSADTVNQVRKEYTRVTLSAGYKNGATAVIFDGTVRQFGWGRENGTDTYLDIFAANNDLAYTQGFSNSTLAAGVTQRQALEAVASDMGLDLALDNSALQETGGVLPRGKVRFGMARAQARIAAQTLESSWSVRNGKLYVTSLKSYLPGEPIDINMLNGMVGIPEQTDQGVLVRVLLNPRIAVGQRVRLNNKDVAQKAFTSSDRAHLPFNQNAALPVQLATVAQSDGTYMVYVCEHQGDTRGQEWYSDLTLLQVDPSSDKVIAP